MGDNSQPFVSVIIPFLNDTERLKTCLMALEAQEYPKHRYEVVLIDNGSEESLDDLHAYSANIRLTRETKPGSYAARNKGISLTQGDIIAFTDADCIPTSNWLKNGTASLLQTPGCGLVGGKIEVFFRSSDKPTSAELFDLLTGFPQEDYVKRQHFGATANVFTFRSVLDQVGLFDADLQSGGDHDWGKRVFAAGYKQIYAEDTCVLHPARYSITDIAKKHVRVVGGLYHIQNKKGYPFRLFIQSLRYSWPRPQHFLSVASDQRLKSRKQKAKVLFVMTIIKCVRIWERSRLWVSDHGRISGFR